MPANEHDSGETSAATGAGGNKSAEHPLRDKMKKKLKGVLDVGYWDTNTVDQDTSYAPGKCSSCRYCITSTGAGIEKTSIADG